MEDKDLRKLSRAELLEMLIQQSKEVERLKAEQAQTRRQLDAITDANALAEAAEKLVAMMADRQLPAVPNLAGSSETREQADAILAQARAEARQMLMDTQTRCDEMVARAREESQRWWSETSRKLDTYYREHPGLREQLAADYGTRR